MADLTNTIIDGDPYTEHEGDSGGAGHEYDLVQNSALSETTLTEDGSSKTTLPLVATFVGTQAEWNALSASQQAKYRIVELTDDSGTDGTILTHNPTCNTISGFTVAWFNNVYFFRVGNFVQAKVVFDITQCTANSKYKIFTLPASFCPLVSLNVKSKYYVLESGEIDSTSDGDGNFDLMIKTNGDVVVRSSVTVSSDTGTHWVCVNLGYVAN